MSAQPGLAGKQTVGTDLSGAPDVPAHDSSPNRPTWGFGEGDQIVAHCTVRSRLGGGSHHETYDAIDDRLFAPVVVKIVRPHLVASERVLRDLRREVDLTERLRHPLIVRSLHHAATGDRPYLALEKLPGQPLELILKGGASLPPERVLDLGMGIATVLHYLRFAHVVHLDVNPNNIIMSGRVPRLIDFDLARGAIDAAKLTSSTGAARCAAPEQCDPPHRGRPGPPSDVWGLGITLFRSVAGRFPFPRGVTTPDTAPEARFPQLTDAPRELPDTTPPALREMIMSCLAADPSRRPVPADVFFALQEISGEGPGGRITAPAPAGAAASAPAGPPDQRELFRAALKAKRSGTGTQRGHARKRSG